MSEPSRATGPEESSSGTSSFRTLIQALVSPREAFIELAREPRTAVALILLVVLGVIAIHVSMARVPAESLFASIEASGRPLPQEAQDDPEKFLRGALWMQTATAVVVGPALYLAMAGIFLVLFRLLGSELTFRQSLATTLHGMLPFAVAAVVGVAAALGRDEISLEELQWGGVVASHLGFLAGEESSKATRALLGSIDLFSAWCVALLAFGYRTVARVGAGSAWAVVLTVWLLGVLIKVGLATAI